jgi:hypothetical protein
VGRALDVYSNMLVVISFPMCEGENGDGSCAGVGTHDVSHGCLDGSETLQRGGRHAVAVRGQRERLKNGLAPAFALTLRDANRRRNAAAAA